jgi:hypothetical protein
LCRYLYTAGLVGSLKKTDYLNSSSPSKEDSSPTKDPLKWFGILVPNILRQSQSTYRKAIEVSVECANLQNEINGVIARKKFLIRNLSKVEEQ